MMKKTIMRVSFFLYIVGVVVLVFALVGLPRAATEPYGVPNSSEIVNEFFEVSPGIFIRMLNLTGGDSLGIQLNVTAGGDEGIDFSVIYGTAVYIDEMEITTLHRNWTVPSNGTYQFVYDNSYSLISKNVTTIVTRYWTEIEYREVIKNLPLLPREFSYVGLILSSVGMGVLIFGLTKHKD